MPTPEPEGSSSREGRHTFSADVSASETPEKTAESNPKSRKPGARALVPAVANKKTGHMQRHKFGLQNQNKSISRANEGQLHLLGRRLYGTENSPWFRGTRAATEQRLRLNLLGWLRGTHWRIESLTRLQGTVYQNLVALHQLQRANQRKSYTRALRLDLKFPDLADEYVVEDSAGGGGGAGEEDRLSLDEQDADDESDDLLGSLSDLQIEEATSSADRSPSPPARPPPEHPTGWTLRLTGGLVVQRSFAHNQPEHESSRTGIGTDVPANMLKAPSCSAPSFDVPYSVSRTRAQEGKSVVSRATGLSVSGSNADARSGDERNLMELLLGSSDTSPRTDGQSVSTLLLPPLADKRTPMIVVTDEKVKGGSAAAATAAPDAAGPEAAKGTSKIAQLRRVRQARERAFRRAVDEPFTWYKLESRFKADRQWCYGIYKPEEVVPVEATPEERAARLPPKNLRFDYSKPTNKRAYHRERERRQQCAQYIESLLKCANFAKSADP